MGKLEEIAGDLRQRIVRGEFAPGERLPNYQTLQKRHEASSVTVRRAVQELVEDGFAVSRERSGVYVADHPPHEDAFGLVFPSAPDPSGRWNRYFSVLREEAVRSGAFRIYHDIDVRRSGPDYARLCEDVARLRLGGVLFASPPWALGGTPLLTADLPPRAAVMGRYEFEETPAIGVGPSLPSALEVFAGAGRTRVARVCASSFAGLASDQAVFEATLAARGMETRTRWTQYVDLTHPETALPATLSLFHAEQTVRPDALFVHDDNLIEPVEDALVRAGVRVPEEVLVVAQCNFPQPPPRRVPMRRVGYDTGELLRIALDLFATRMRGEAPPPVSIVPCRTEPDGAEALPFVPSGSPALSRS